MKKVIVVCVITLVIGAFFNIKKAESVAHLAVNMRCIADNTIRLINLKNNFPDFIYNRYVNGFIKSTGIFVGYYIKLIDNETNEIVNNDFDENLVSSGSTYSIEGVDDGTIITIEVLPIYNFEDEIIIQDPLHGGYIYAIFKVRYAQDRPRIIEITIQ